MQITVVGLGLTRGQLTMYAADALKSGQRIILRTARCDAAAWLSDEGIPYESLDGLYETLEDFSELRQRAAEIVVGAAQREPLVYGVLDLRDETVQAIAERGEDLRWIPGVPVDAELTGCACSPCQCFAACDAGEVEPDAGQNALVREISSRVLAGEVKLALLRRYPPDLPIQMLTAQGRISCPLCELDRQPAYDHRTSAFIPGVADLTRLTEYGFSQLNRIMRILRAPDGCPWDRKQTHESLRETCVEEAWEVADAIDRGNMDDLCEELGDLLMQITLHSEIARQHGEFTIDDVTGSICRKMISRHTHIFGTDRAKDSQEVLDLWEKNKQKEKHLSSTGDSMETVAKAMPALMRAEKVQKKAKSVGFDWEDWRGALEKISEEAGEVLQAARDGDDLAMEIGDLLFAAVNVSRLLHVSPELALNRSTDKFIRRFSAMERMIREDGKDMREMTLPEMDVYWDRVKAEMKFGQ